MKSETPQPANIGDVHSNEPGSGARYNAGKPAFELVPLVALEDCAKVFDYGRQKYAPWNWAKGMPWSAPLGCLLRHLSAWQRGEDNDPESGLPHLGHVMANLVMLTTYARTYPQGDDRTEWLKEAAAQKDPPDRIRCKLRMDKPECSTCGRPLRLRKLPTGNGVWEFECTEHARLLDEAQKDIDDVTGMKPNAANTDRADRLAYLARWANAPAEATHLAQDPDEFNWWFLSEPEQDEHGKWQGACVGGTKGTNILGRVACEPRPENVIDPKREAYLKRWNQIPQWANYLTQDVNGANTIWAHRPEKSPSGDRWVVSSNEPNSRFSHFFGDGHALGLGYFGCEVRPGLKP